MARGWESKSVEQQQEEMSEQRKAASMNAGRAPISAGDQQRNRKHEGLVLSRQRLAQQLQVACNPRHRHMLEQSLAELDRQLSALEQVTDPTSPK